MNNDFDFSEVMDVLEEMPVGSLEGISEYIDIEQEKFEQIREILPFDEWIENEYYVGIEGTKYLWDYWKDTLTEFFSPPKKNILILEGCFIGSTKISLLDGTEKSLKDLAENHTNDKFWVYSIDEQNHIVPGLAYDPRLTIKNAKVYKVTLDNNEEIFCTENHKFMLRNGSYREAKDLKPNDSLMPLYREGGENEYEKVYDPKDNKYKKTHTIVNEYCHKRPINQKKKSQWLVTHHKNFNLHDNTPSNLIWMWNKDHWIYHSKHANFRGFWNKFNNDGGFRKKIICKLRKNGRKQCLKRNSDPKFIAKVQVANKIFYHNRFYDKSNVNNLNELLKTLKSSDTIDDASRKLNSTRKRIFAQLRREGIDVYSVKDLREQNILNNNVDWHNVYNYSKRKKTMRKNTFDNFLKKINMGNLQDVLRNLKLCKNTRDIKNMFDWMGLLEYFLRCNGFNINYVKDYIKCDLVDSKFNPGNSSKISYLNHKVVSVEFSHYEDVYNVSVEKYHNFALSFKDNSGIIVKNSLGGGKTHASIFAFIYLKYQLSCYNFPSLRFGLSKSSSIVFMYLAPTLNVAEFAGFGRMRSIIDQCPYFLELFKRNERKTTVLDFENRKILSFSGSNIGHFTGADLFGIIFDEANFTRSGGGDIGKLDKAVNIYRESTNRRKSRFIFEGEEYGISIIASSADTLTSFTEQEIEKNRSNPRALIKHVTKYDLQPEHYDKRRFTVFVGEKNNDAFVVNPENKIKYKTLLEYLHVKNAEEYLCVENINDIKIPKEYSNLFTNPPMNFYDSYILDVINSLKEIDGVAVQNQMKFFNETTKFYICVNSKLEHPFYKEHIVLSTGTNGNELIENFKKGDDNEIIDAKLEKNEIPDYGVRGIKDINYYLSVDLSKTNDSTGLALGHYDKRKSKTIIDFMMRVDPPNYPEKIDYSKIIEFIMWLRNERNYKIKGITLDQYQSEFFIQYFNKKRINSFVFSVDRTDEHYIFMRNKLIMNEIEFYLYPQFEFELFNLIHDIGNKKVNHPPQQGKYAKDGGFGKDVCDAVCALVYQVFMNESISTGEIKNTLSGLISEINRKKHSKVKNTLKMEEKLLNCKGGRNIKLQKSNF